MRKVLRLVAAELDRQEAGGPAEFLLVADALEYMHAFPSQVHHPKEDAIFERLSHRDPGCSGLVAELREQHLQLYEVEGWLRSMALRRPSPGGAESERFIRFGREYLRLQRDHARSEEAVLFPRSMEVLDPDDWARVKAIVQEIDDPLSGEQQEGAFQLLYQCLLRDAGGA